MGDQFLVDPRWILKVEQAVVCKQEDVAYMIGGDSGQLASSFSNKCRVVLAEPNNSLGAYLESLGLYRTMIIRADPALVLGDMRFDIILSTQPNLISEFLMQKLLRVPFREAIFIMPQKVLKVTKTRGKLGVLLRACFEFNILQKVPSTAYSPKLSEHCDLVKITRPSKMSAIAKSLHLLVSQSGTIRGILTRSCREFFGYTLAEAQDAVKMLDQKLLRKRFWDITENEFKEIHQWLKL